LNRNRAQLPPVEERVLVVYGRNTHRQMNVPVSNTVLNLKTRILELNEPRFFRDLALTKLNLVSGNVALADDAVISTIPSAVEINAKYEVCENNECQKCFNFVTCFLAPCGHYYCFGCFSDTFLKIQKQGGVFSCVSDIQGVSSGNDTCRFIFNQDILFNILNQNTEFEENIYIALNNIQLSYMQTKQCPNCKVECVRRNADIKLRCNTNLCNGRTIFCWFCGFAWGNNNSITDCGNETCIHEDSILKLLRECGTHRICGVDAPKVRICPHCNTPVYHSGKNCKFIHGCLGCKIGWCFICLQGERIVNGSKKADVHK